MSLLDYRINPREKLSALSRRLNIIVLTPVLPSELILSYVIDFDIFLNPCS